MDEYAQNADGTYDRWRWRGLYVNDAISREVVNTLLSKWRKIDKTIRELNAVSVTICSCKAALWVKCESINDSRR